MKNDVLKSLTAAAVLMTTSVSSADTQESSAPASVQSAHTQGVDATSKEVFDAHMLSQMREIIIEQNFPELSDTQPAVDIAVLNGLACLEDLELRIKSGEPLEKEDILNLYHMTPAQRLEFLTHVEQERYKIKLYNDEALLLTEGMTQSQLEQYYRIKTRQDAARKQTLGDLVKFSIEIFQSGGPFYSAEPQPLIKRQTPKQKTTRLHE